ncbi:MULTISPECIES: hypothetical protein [unclassified Cellvibrio]|uniref:hypothetical protein n=1 Tax=unclassified Cellvibrio TaxID=2624793 RepID=UPI001246137B|nr:MULTISPECIES: hypothetical protein [unclassified Cellvibrio]QEY15956.1 hypothetical protein D0C16_08205 [Cellvibrio sp. KY-GH-1]UUA74942.1 hypothetical protein NNX04_21010 [Cellvibrio sp. QJXJ]
MLTLSRILIAIVVALFLSACQTTVPNTSGIVFEEDALRQHNLELSNATANFNDGTLTISGGIGPTQKRPHIACGQLQLRILDTQGVLLKTLNTDYSPCHLHYGPNTRRTGSFSVVINDIHQQALIIKASYQKKPHEAH